MTNVFVQRFVRGVNESGVSEIIVWEIMIALLVRQAKIILVTNMYELTHGVQERNQCYPLFQRGKRQDDGEPTFELREGELSRTSFVVICHKINFEEISSRSESEEPVRPPVANDDIRIDDPAIVEPISVYAAIFVIILAFLAA